jgi:membrane protein implicated in regulation of membrane protease activity
MAEKQLIVASRYIVNDAVEVKFLHERDTPSESLFRFRLRHLLLFVAAVSTLMAGLVTFRGIPAVGFLLAALVVAFHVFGTALGSRLRSNADRARARANSSQAETAGRGGKCDHRSVTPETEIVQPPWYARGGVPLPWISRLTAIAVCLGGCLGAVLLTLTVGHRTSAAGLVLGAMSLATLSGWFAFLGGNFYANVRRGLREALDDQRHGEAVTE